MGAPCPSTCPTALAAARPGPRAAALWASQGRHSRWATARRLIWNGRRGSFWTKHTRQSWQKTRAATGKLTERGMGMGRVGSPSASITLGGRRVVGHQQPRMESFPSL